MRVCIIGNSSEPLDEGMKKITAELANALSKHCDIIVLNPLEVFKWGFWKSLFRFKPQVIHYVPGPSIRSFILLWMTKFLTNANTVLSLTHPDPKLPIPFVCRYLQPDLLLSQSINVEQEFKKNNCKIIHIPNGVDTLRFRPVSSDEKLRLREKYGIPQEAYVLLHVGNTRYARNLSILPKIKGEDLFVLVIGSTTIVGDAEINKLLAEAGCVVWNKYIEPIEEIYALSDCYIFPTTNPVGAVDFPLSVLEAMACNLPIITSKYGALTRYFKEGTGLYYISNNENVRDLIKDIRYSDIQVTTRERVKNLTWGKVADDIIREYQGLIKSSI